ncbi:carbohydrate ABC transporter permease [Streptomyces morookaense]|uniref:Sugar ABC transporter permease n=1 Tax=Streptomyces morookaense TaxID=1970 RepID=A0A7Y7EAW1_STRMO|nr:sugar ABC transporter permease [Streptomyces morookaense]NVK81916.1 sugar ABC transporter permease [Streptomyces morookaense]GHF54544.1 ABC transporter permease [Streptomyces morookaense]
MASTTQGTRVTRTRKARGALGTRPWAAACFLLPALALLGALVVYPIGYSVYRSLFDASGHGFVGLGNYHEVFSDDRIRTALKNNVIWVVVAPTVATALGLIFAVLTERVRWGTAFKLVVFMPMAISMLAAGIIFRLVYEQNPDRGVANAVWVGIHDTFASPAPYPGARPRPNADLAASGGGAYTTRAAARAGTPVLLPLVAVKPEDVNGAHQAAPAKAVPGKVTGTVWMDFTRGGGGTPGRIDPGEKALAGLKVEAVKGGTAIASATTAADGTFTLPASADGARLRLPAANFASAYGGVDWLGPSLVTPSIIGAYIWMWAGFAMVLIAAGLAGVPRELLEAARVDGANEWQVFRRVTVPLLAPVLAVVVVTLMINVLKIFDLVYIIAPGSSLHDANVLALQLYQSSFGTDVNQGVGSAIAVFLLLLVLPVMYVNLRRIRREREQRR